MADELYSICTFCVHGSDSRCVFLSSDQDSVEEERGSRLRGYHLLHLLQQHALLGARHHRFLLLAEELQPHCVSFSEMLHMSSFHETMALMVLALLSVYRSFHISQ